MRSKLSFKFSFYRIKTWMYFIFVLFRKRRTFLIYISFCILK